MPATAPSASALFEDGLGKRHFTTGPAGEPLDVLVLSEDLRSVPGFEAALRARPAPLATFQHPSVTRVRGLVRLAKGQRLGIVSDHVDGIRLSELLAVAERGLIPLPFDAARWIAGELVSSLAAFHAALPEMCHGAIAPERIIITPDGAMVVADYVLGAALEQLRFSPERHWKDLRVALPPTAEHPRFDERTDLVQAGAVTLALILGRPLRDAEDPAVNPALLADARALSAAGDLAPLPTAFRAWLSRMLQVVPQQSFASFADAATDLHGHTALAEGTSGREAFTRFLAACSTAMIDAPPARASLPAAASGSAGSAPETPAVPATTPAPAAQQATPEPQASVATQKVSSPPPIGPSDPAPMLAIAAEADDAPMDRDDATEGFFAVVKSHARALAIAAAALVVMSLAGVAAHMYASAAPPDAAGGTLIVTTDPAGAPVVIDGRQRGVTPVTLTMAAGEHVMVLGNTAPRTVHLRIAPGAQVSQFYQLPHAAPVVGELQVRSDPVGARVSVDGEAHGVTPVTVGGLVPGPHVVLLENDLGSVKEDVQIEAGATASLVVPMTAPKGAPLSGWISVESPGDVQLFENQQLLGSNRIDRIMLPVGRHDLEIVNDALGFRSAKSVQITAGQVTRIAVDWPTGSLALNALPWADVWLDGQRIGQTPMANIPVPIGVHDIVFRHPELGERRFKATVTVGATARLSADLRKK
jgi:hypothetical protein